MTLTQITEKGIKDGEIVNADINASAAIAKSKLASLDIVDGDINASASIAKSKLASLDIVNGDINASAAIAGSKINPSFTSDITITNTQPKIFLTDSNNTSDFSIQNENGNLNFYDETNDTSRIRIISTGKVGIGKTSPSFKLDIAADNASLLRLTNTEETSHGSHNCRFGAGGSSYQNLELFASSYLFNTYDGSTEDTRMTIDSSGNVGIGTTSPSQKLTLKGLSSFEATNSTNGWVLYTHTDNTFRFNYNGAGNDEVIINSDGRVGIGSTVTGCNLTVAGKGLAITGQNLNHSANSLRLGEEGSGKAQIRCYGPDNSTFGSLEVLLTAADGSGNLGDITFERESNGANIKLPAGGGISFAASGGTGASGASTTNSILDDYEEGTWTPSYFSTGGTYGYHTQTGKYRKVGNVVTVIAYIRTSSVSATSHNLVKVSGLPFTEGGSLRTPGSVRCNGFQGTLTNMEYPSGWSVEAGQTFGELQRFTDGGFTDFTTSTMNNSTFVYLQCTYITA